MLKRHGSGDNRASAICPCGEPGWPKKQASVERARMSRIVRRHPGRSPAVLMRECVREDSELSHVRIVAVDGPPPTSPRQVLMLPARPYEPVPASGTFVMVSYRVEVAAGLATVIEQQRTDRLMPGIRKLTAHYGMSRADAVAVRDELLARHLIRLDAGRYVTQAPASSTVDHQPGSTSRWPICPVCQHPGWTDPKVARSTISKGRVPKVRARLGRLVDDGNGQLRLYHCGPGLGLWHITNLTDEKFRLLIAPLSLELPEAPSAVPSRGSKAWRGYLHRIAGVFVFAIHDQGRGRAVPSAAEFASHYSVDRSWARVQMANLVKKGLLRNIGGLYVTGTSRSSDRSSR